MADSPLTTSAVNKPADQQILSLSLSPHSSCLSSCPSPQFVLLCDRLLAMACHAIACGLQSVIIIAIASCCCCIIGILVWISIGMDDDMIIDLPNKHVISDFIESFSKEICYYYY